MGLGIERKNETPVLIGLAFALAIFAINAVGAVNSWHTLSLIASSLLISVCILFPLPIGFGAVLIVLASLSLEQPEFSLLQTIRAALFASTCLLLSRVHRPLPPFYWVVLLWIVFLLALPQLNLVADSEITGNSVGLLCAFYIEVLVVLVLTIVGTTGTAHDALRLRKIEFDSRAYCVQFLSLAVLITTPLAFLFGIRISGTPLDAALQNVMSSFLPFSVSIAAALLIPLILGLIVGQLIHDFTASLMQAAMAQGVAFNENRRWLFKEFKDTVRVVLGCIEGLEGDLRAFRAKTRELAQEAEARENEVKDRELRAANLTRLLSETPWGAVACFANRSIIEVNRSLLHLLDPDEPDLRGKDIKNLVTPHPWSGEIVDTLEWAVQNYAQLLQSGPQRYVSSAFDGRYLEMHIQAAVTASALQASQNRPADKRSPSDVTLLLFCRSNPDMRLFQLSTFTPSKLDVVEKHALTACTAIDTQLKGVLDDTAELTKMLRKQHNSDANHGLKLLVQDIQRLTDEARAALAGTEALEIPGELEEVDLMLHLQNSLAYISDLLALEQPITAKISTAHADSGDNDRQLLAHAVPKLNISIDDLNIFLASLMSMLRSIIPDSQHLSIEVGSEQIGTATANILATAVTGHFARIDIHHEGQSITPNMTLRTLAELSTAERVLQPTEIAIVLLSFHTRRLGGFLSFQSSAARGTELSVYIPVTRPRIGSLLPRSIASQTPPSIDENPFAQGESAHILLVSPEDSEISALKKMLVHLGHQVIFDDAEGYAGGEDLAFDSGGHGFDSTSSSVFDQPDVNDTASRVLEEAALYDLILINTSKVYPMESIQLQAIADRYPKIPKVILHEYNSYTPPIENTLVLRKPFDLEEIDRLVSGILAGKSKSSSAE